MRCVGGRDGWLPNQINSVSDVLSNTKPSFRLPDACPARMLSMHSTQSQLTRQTQKPMGLYGHCFCVVDSSVSIYLLHQTVFIVHSDVDPCAVMELYNKLDHTSLSVQFRCYRDVVQTHFTAVFEPIIARLDCFCLFLGAGGSTLGWNKRRSA